MAAEPTGTEPSESPPSAIRRVNPTKSANAVKRNASATQTGRPASESHAIITALLLSKMSTAIR